MSDMQIIIDSLNTMELALQMGIVKLPLESATELARIEAVMLANELRDSDTSADAMNKAAEFMAWIERVGQVA